MIIVDWYTALAPLLQGLFGYLLIINVITFLSFGIDKFAAIQEAPRISEKSLWIMAAIGGSIGAMIAMKFFRHKRRKVSFYSIVVLLFIIQALLVYIAFPYLEAL
jgi:uncharacterized membrane protein YsdA (DUF1294 family)